MFEYDVKKYDFKGCIADMLGIDYNTDLTKLHLTSPALQQYLNDIMHIFGNPNSAAQKDDDYSSVRSIDTANTAVVPTVKGPGRQINPYLRNWKQAWSSNKFDPMRASVRRLENLLLRFAKEFIEPRLHNEPCLFQREPTLRVSILAD